MRTVLLATLLAAAPPPERTTTQRLRDHCLIYAADVKNPWALAHGITAFGPQYLASDGRKADEVLIHDFLKRNKSDAGSPYGFSRFDQAGTPIEPHTNLIVKTLVLAGVPKQHGYTSPWGQKLTLQALIDSTKLGYRHVPSSPEYWKDVAWTLDVLTHAGTDKDVEAVMNDAMTELEHADAELEAGMKQGLPSVEKRKQGIYAHSCGGLHFVQAVLTYQSKQPHWRDRVRNQIDILMYRVASESKQYQAALAQMPQYRVELLVQQLKFYGHFLEATARLRTETQWRPDEVQRRIIETAKAYLDATVRELDELKVFEPASLDTLTSSKPQLFLDLIGDACHATHGLDGWRSR